LPPELAARTCRPNLPPELAARTCRHHTNIDGDGSVGHGAGIGLRDTIERNRSRLKMGLSNELCSLAFHNGIRSANNMLN
jgi:hypothetical protein